MGWTVRIVVSIPTLSRITGGALSQQVPPAFENWVEELAWKTNPPPRPMPSRCRLHLGCGNKLLPGFVNIDFIPLTPSVLLWDVLGCWPAELAGSVECAFSEDTLEHFFFDEQAYILAQMNMALENGGVFRVLMPNIDLLVGVGKRFGWERDRDEFLSKYFGVRSGADAINLGMRFGGHRWLHNVESLNLLASSCGFEAIQTSCKDSTVAALCGLNLRSETNSLSFAHDLVKQASLDRWTLEPVRIVNAEPAGELMPGQPLYRAVSNDAQIHYGLPGPIDREQIGLVALRGANLSQFREHNYSEVYLVDDPSQRIPIDSSMSSCPHMRVVAAPLISARVSSTKLERLRYDPSRHTGDYFSVGPAEVFIHSGTGQADAA